MSLSDAAYVIYEVSPAVWKTRHPSEHCLDMVPRWECEYRDRYLAAAEAVAGLGWHDLIDMGLMAGSGDPGDRDRKLVYVWPHDRRVT